MKKLILDTIEPYAKSYGYEVQVEKGVLVYFHKKEELYVLSGAIQWSRDGEHLFVYSFCINPVEAIIMDVGTPDMDFESYKRGESFYNTVNELKSYYKAIIVQTESDAIEYANFVGDLLTDQMLEFAEHYSYLPNVLTEMNRLEAEGKYWNGIRGSGGILGGGSDSFFRGLIISKLCNDPDYDRKLKMVDELFYEDPTDKWIPYYDKLKVRLQDLQPKY
jgi:hypothetical protein